TLPLVGQHRGQPPGSTIGKTRRHVRRQHHRLAPQPHRLRPPRRQHHRQHLRHIGHGQPAAGNDRLNRHRVPSHSTSSWPITRLGNPVPPVKRHAHTPTPPPPDRDQPVTTQTRHHHATTPRHAHYQPKHQPHPHNQQDQLTLQSPCLAEAATARGDRPIAL